MANNTHFQMNELILGLTVWQGISQPGSPGILRMFSLAAPRAMAKIKLPGVPQWETGELNGTGESMQIEDHTGSWHGPLPLFIVYGRPRGTILYQKNSSHTLTLNEFSF